MTQHRITKKRTLQKAGFVHVAGWVPADKAEAIIDQIKAAQAAVEGALTKLSYGKNQGYLTDERDDRKTDQGCQQGQAPCPQT